MTRTAPREHPFILKAFRTYLQFVNSGLYFKKEHILGLENVPVNGTPTVIVSNHQNCLNDPLCVCLKLTDRRMNFLARANDGKIIVPKNEILSYSVVSYKDASRLLSHNNERMVLRNAHEYIKNKRSAANSTRPSTENKD